MAQRPVFIPKYIGSSFVAVEYIDFEWHPGMTLGQKQKSVVSLHTSAHQALGVKNILEISTKSSNPIGSALSAFNLMMNVPDLKRPTCVECVYQGSKVFEMGGPFIDIFQMTALEAKKDSRLSTSGHLVGFSFSSIDWVLQPQTAFYNWIYINALRQQFNLFSEIENFDCFTDIEFNPKKSINCQAYAVALFLSLHRRGMLSDAISSPRAFLQCTEGVQDVLEQGQLF